MIATLSGTLTDRSTDTLVIETEGGVGYHVTVPTGVLDRLPSRGERCKLHTELVIREDAWTLYGFDRLEDRSIFQRLLTASGFGPKLALALLSHLGPERTVRAIQSKDIPTLSSVSGIGRKKAERLVLELHDRFTDLTIAPSPRGPSGGNDAARALVALGYSASQAEEAVELVAGDGGDQSLGAVVRRALQLLSARGGKG